MWLWFYLGLLSYRSNKNGKRCELIGSNCEHFSSRYSCCLFRCWRHASLIYNARRTKEAIRRLSAAGIVPILATGRPSYQLTGLDLEGFQAFVTINGQLCYTPERTLVERPLDKEDIAVVVDQVQHGLYDCLFMERDRFYVSGKGEREQRQEKLIGVNYPVDDPARALEHDIFQLNVYLPPEDLHIIRDATHNTKFAGWTDNFSDVMSRDGGKASGALEVLKQLGISPEKTIAFGDGGNDLELFEVVGTSVAMGNANPEVLEQATMITDDVDHDGIYNACVRLGLI